ncbi:hypothetical protein D3C73_1457560 [compost metagenome]
MFYLLLFQILQKSGAVKSIRCLFIKHFGISRHTNFIMHLKACTFSPGNIKIPNEYGLNTELFSFFNHCINSLDQLIFMEYRTFLLVPIH